MEPEDIESNIVKTSQQTAAGKKQLKMAEKSQRKLQGKYCCIFAIVGIVMAVLLTGELLRKPRSTRPPPREAPGGRDGLRPGRCGGAVSCRGRGRGRLRSPARLPDRARA